MDAPASSSSSSSSPSSTSTTTTTTSTTSIFSLPNEVLVMIVDLLPLRDLVHINEVSRGWIEPRTAVFSTRKELVISKKIINNHLEVGDARRFLNSVMNGADKGEDDISLFTSHRPVDFDRVSLLTSQFSPKMVDGITGLMPDLRVLWIMQEGGYAELGKMKHLLDHYRHQLKEVLIQFKGSVDVAHRDHLEIAVNGFRETVPSLIASLNRLTALDRLHLSLLVPPALAIPVDTVELSVARRLKKLSVTMFGFSFVGSAPRGIDALQTTYQRYAEANERLEELKGANRFHLNTVLAFGPRVSAALRQVHLVDQLDGAPAQLAALRQLAAQCPRLESLDLSFAGLSMAQVAEALTPFRSLHSLVLFNLNFDASQGPVARAANAGFEAAAAAAGQQLPSPQQPPPPLPVLPSVKVLYIFVNTGTHSDFESMGLDVIFPNVEEVSMQHTFRGCRLCHFTLPSRFAQQCRSVQVAYGLLIHECQRLARTYFQDRFSKLKFLLANVGLEELPPSLQRNVIFKREEIDQVTYDAQGSLVGSAIARTEPL